jgi:hypothetical protein
VRGRILITPNSAKSSTAPKCLGDGDGERKRKAAIKAPDTIAPGVSITILGSPLLLW